MCPGSCGVHCLPVDSQPGAQLEEALLQHWRDGALLGGTHVHDEVTAQADGPRQKSQQVRQAQVIGQGGLAAVPPGLPVDRQRILPLLSWRHICTVQARAQRISVGQTSNTAFKKIRIFRLVRFGTFCFTGTTPCMEITAVEKLFFF